MPGGEQRDERRPDGTFLPGNSTKAQSWAPGESGNPSGMPKGYLAPSLRLRKKFGTEEGWGALESALDAMLSSDKPDVAAVNALLRTVIGNDHALDKRDTSEGEDAPPPTVVLEEEINAERDDD